MVLVLLAGPAGALTFTVDSTGDAKDANTGDDTCDAVGGGCTLRAAMEQANASTGHGMWTGLATGSRWRTSRR